MQISDEFREIWERHEVRGIENHIKRFRHPNIGVMTLHQTSWWSAPRNGDRLLRYVPMDDASKQSLQKLADDAAREQKKTRKPKKQAS